MCRSRVSESTMNTENTTIIMIDKYSSSRVHKLLEYTGNIPCMLSHTQLGSSVDNWLKLAATLSHRSIV